MQKIDLLQIPAQDFTVNFGDSVYAVRLKFLETAMFADVYIDNVPIILGIIVVAGSPIIPYRDLENGNFIFITNDGNLPDYRNFNTTHNLFFLTQAELQELRNV